MGILLFFLFIIIPLHPAEAYIDPGTGGSIFSALGVLFPAFGVLLGFLVRPVKKLVKKAITICTSRRKKDSSDNIATSG